MAVCSAATLLEDACASGFTCRNQQDLLAIELEMMSQAFGNTLTGDGLLAASCLSGFNCRNSQDLAAIENAMWCDLQ